MPHLQFIFLSLLFGTCHHVTPSLSYEQGQINGIYYILDEGRCLDNEVKQVDISGVICILDKPLLTVEDISEMSKPVEDVEQGVRSLTIRLSEEGGKKLSLVTEMYPGEQLALVLDNIVVFILTIERTITSGEIVLKEGLKGKTLDYTYRTLQEALDE